jgi:hydroxymethylpyrimidine pyrophosphatase-like HAD family hydrolase
MSLVKAIIADVDGVMVGKHKGINFPLPHKQEIDALKKVSSLGIPVILCTAKFNFAIKGIAQLAHLDNPHITDGGAVIMNFTDNTVIKKFPINRKIVEQYVRACLAQSIYTEIYTSDTYYIDSSQQDAFTVKRSHLLQQEPQVSASLYEISKTIETIKIVNFIETDEQRVLLDKIVTSCGSEIHFIWSHHPYLAPFRAGVMTAANVSKASASKELIKMMRLSFDSVLGIGDAASDWNFMQLCKYVATVGNESEELKQNARSRPSGEYFLAPDVDSHGLLDIFKHFKLL